MFEFESQFGTVILEYACAVCVMCAVLVVSHWWYLIGGKDRMVYLFGGISLVVYLIGGISLVVSHYRVLPGTTRGRGRGVGGGLCPCLQLSVMDAFVNMFIPATRMCAEHIFLSTHRCGGAGGGLVPCLQLCHLFNC